MSWLKIINELAQWFFLIPLLVLCAEHDNKIEAVYNLVLIFLEAYKRGKDEETTRERGDQ